MPTSLDARPEEYPAFSTRAPIEILEDGTDYSSSNVHSLLYDFGAVAPEGVDQPARQMLVARFYRDGVDAVYEYDGFPVGAWQSLAEASSKGRWINLNVKGVYSFTKLRMSRWPDGVGSIRNARARKFFTTPMTAKPEASHPHL